MVKADEVPNTLEGMADHRWRQVRHRRGGAGLDILSLKLGHDRVLDIAKKLLANGPLIQTGAAGAAC
jgi:hypothetical protein